MTLAMHPDGLLAAMVHATPGLCVFCEEPLPKRRRGPRMVCGSPACWTAYHSAYGRDRRLGIHMLRVKLLAYFEWCTGGTDVAALHLSVPGNGGEGA